MTTHIINGYRVSTSNICPPIATRKFDWIAVLDDAYDGAHDSGEQIIGHGETEKQAIGSLFAEIEQHQG